METSTITHNVTKGVNTLYGYKKLELIRFPKKSFATKYLKDLNVKERAARELSSYDAPYHSLTIQDGCSHSCGSFYC